MSSIGANGVKLFYTEKVSGENVVLVHGVGGGDYRAWASHSMSYQLDLECSRTADDFLHQIKTNGTFTKTRWINNTEDPRRVIRRLNMSIHLVGHSYGARSQLTLPLNILSY
jgi:pimeloyl-ACP methyl ester carboxylesterase